jgi:hypothetical protein
MRRTAQSGHPGIGGIEERLAQSRDCAGRGDVEQDHDGDREDDAQLRLLTCVSKINAKLSSGFFAQARTKTVTVGQNAHLPGLVGAIVMVVVDPEPPCRRATT